MQNDLENLLKLLEKSFNTNNLSELQSLEKEIVEISSHIKKAINSPENIDNQFNKNDLETLENLINKISSKQKDQKSFISDFQNFVKNRKIN
ncbi:MAG: hypothetical protein CMM92_03975 [Rickettsiales bacterium]|nr:hypothetical protein [Rickettsiales bacterium]RPG14267.1 MAG: hypothetical protein CBD55_003955 [Pelagibacteraceae bacterium TMED195]|tara:strand:+ start:1566 stop:1841 length:276 start_codon:yes stop_codon:yes gene_type:complete